MLWSILDAKSGRRPFSLHIGLFSCFIASYHFGEVARVLPNWIVSLENNHNKMSDVNKSCAVVVDRDRSISFVCGFIWLPILTIGQKLRRDKQSNAFVPGRKKAFLALALRLCLQQTRPDFLLGNLALCSKRFAFTSMSEFFPSNKGEGGFMLIHALPCASLHERCLRKMHPI